MTAEQKVRQKDNEWRMTLTANGAHSAQSYLGEISAEEKLKIMEAREVINLKQPKALQGNSFIEDDSSLIAARKYYLKFQTKCAEALRKQYEDEEDMRMQRDYFYGEDLPKILKLPKALKAAAFLIEVMEAVEARRKEVNGDWIDINNVLENKLKGKSRGVSQIMYAALNESVRKTNY